MCTLNMNPCCVLVVKDKVLAGVNLRGPPCSEVGVLDECKTSLPVECAQTAGEEGGKKSQVERHVHVTQSLSCAVHEAEG